MDGVRLRPMECADLDAVVRLEAASYAVPWSAATFRALLERGDALALVAVRGAEVVGYAVFWAVGDQGELGNVAVAGTWRRRGLAGRLLTAVLERAAEMGVGEVFLEVRPSNLGARKLYERFGFQLAGRRRQYYRRPVEDALVMRRTLAAAPPGTD